MKFWALNLYYKQSNWKTWLSERFSEVLTSELWKKIHAAKAYRNRAKLNYTHPLCFKQKSLTDHSKGEPHEIHEKKESQ